MHQETTDFDRWYVRLLAVYFTLLCGVCSVRYLWMDITGNGYVPLLTQLFCFAVTAASIVFFVHPRLGHHLLLSLTVIVLLYFAPTGPAQANLFWLFVAALLGMPLLFPRRPVGAPY